MKYRFEIKIYFYMKPLTLSDLRTRQAWPLNQKIDHTCYAMETFVAYCKEHDRTPYVSFSGGSKLNRPARLGSPVRRS